jgi:hypothetical protein
MLLSGCGRGVLASESGVDPHEKLGSCGKNPLLDLKPAIRVDAMELRMTCKAENPPGATGRALLSSGSSCAAGACAADVEALDGRLMGWEAPRPPSYPCKQYLVGMREDRVVVSAANDAELRSLMGPFDTRGEAELLVMVHEITCVRSGQDGSRFLIASTPGESECPSGLREMVYAVDARGVLDRLPQRERNCVEGASSK